MLALFAQMVWPWTALGWVVLVPWLGALDRARSLRHALALGWLLAVATEFFVFGWFADGLAEYADAPRGLAWLAILVLAPWLQPQWLVFAAGRHLLRGAARQRGFARAALTSACLYVGSEWAIPKLFEDTLGHGLYGSLWMRQAADLAGAPGLTFVLVVGNECLLAAVRALAGKHPLRRRLRAALAPAGLAAGLALALSAYGAIRVAQVDGDGAAPALVRVGIVQADISRYGRLRNEVGTYAAVRAILDTHFALSREALARGDVRLLVWPETVYPTTFGSPKSEQGAAFDREIGAFVARTGVPLVFGAYDVEGGDEFNAAVFLEPDPEVPGRVGFDTYRKAWLFPLTERVPAWLDSPRLRERFPWLGNWKAGAGAQAMSLALAGGRSLRVAPLICYDTIDPGLARAAVLQGADLILTLSNDSWFASGGGPRLHLMHAAFRSIETRRPQIRATNTGISAVIDAAGRVRASLGVHEKDVLVTAVPASQASGSLALAWGAWLGPLACAGAGFEVAVALTRGRTRRT